MIEIKQVKTQDEVNYTFVEKLMHTAFPQEERRDTVQQREYSDNNPRFCNNIILENGNSIGMISYWTMGDFYYIEHFAIDPSLRNGGYGKRVLEMIKKQLKGPIVLEVEEPNDEMSTRRIHFYKRLEFTLHKKPYIQPPYRKGDSGLPMLLMTYGDIDMESDFEKVKKTLYFPNFTDKRSEHSFFIFFFNSLSHHTGVCPQKIHCTYYY